jgi:hypothetical protein
MADARVIVCAAALLAAAGCSFSVSAGGPDYDKLQNEIQTKLDDTYTSMNQKVSSVTCPHPSPAPKAGDKFTCTADVDGNDIRVQVTMKDDDNVEYETLDNLYDLPGTGKSLSEELSKQYEFDVSVDCGEGLKVVEVGKTMECTATDPGGETRTVTLTAAPPGENDKWELQK